ncbi:YcxB family protein [Actinopolymorpha pittospori]
MIYTLTAKEFHGGMRTRARLLRSMRVARVCLIVGMVCAILWIGLQAILLVTGHSEDVDGGILAGFVAGVIVLTVWVPWLRRRSYRRLSEAMGQMHVTLDGTGVHGVGKNKSGTSSWAAYGRYVETEDLFVLLSPDPKYCIVTILPKRGIEAPADAERLRAVLDQHVQRVNRR